MLFLVVLVTFQSIVTITMERERERGMIMAVGYLKFTDAFL